MIFIACIFVSCKDEPDIKYHTPTAIGRITLDSGVSASLGDFFIQVSDTGAQFNTNSDGTWAVTGLESGKEYTLYFSNKPFGNNISRAVGDDVSYGARKDHVYGQAGNGRDNGTVVIRQNGAISGRITLNDSPDDHSGIDITIPGTSFATKTAADGTFRLSDIPEGTYVLKISKTGYETKTLDDVKVTIEGDDTITELPDMEIASGQGIVTGVVGFNGLISGNLIPATTVSLVSLTDNALIASVEASADTGEFTIYKVFPGTYKLQIQADGCQLYEESLEVKAGVTTTVGKKLLSLDGGTVTGVVKDIEGNPLKSAFIQVSSNEMPFRFTAQTSEDGRFSIQNCIPGENSIEISKLGYATETKKITVVEGSSTDIGDAKLYIESAILKGRCILSGESNNSGVVVSIKNTKTGNSFDAVTTEDGSFEIAGINVVGTYSISYSKTGFKSAVSSIDIAEFGKVFMAADMSLYSAYATIKGNVALYDGGSADGVAVLFELQDGTNSYDTTTNSSGDYIITKVLPGMYNMTISKAGYDSRTVLGIPVSESEYKVMDDVVLKAKTRTISGNVSLTGTSNHSGVAVTATNMNKPELVYSAITNSDGAYYMNNITAGRYIVTFSKDRYISPEAEVVDLTSALEAVVDAKTMSLAAGGVTGKVKANGLSDHSGIVVTLTHSTSPEIIRTTVTDISGYYAFNDLTEEGTYILTATKDDFVSSSPKSVKVFNGEVSEVEEIVLKSSYAMLNGRFVLYDDKTDSSGIKVHIEMEDGTNAQNTETNISGDYSFSKVVPGTYKVTASKDGYDNSEILGVVLSESEVKSVEEHSLSAKTRTISGNIKLSGQESHAGISILVSDVSTAIQHITQTNSDGDFSVAGLSKGKYSVIVTKEGYVSPDVIVVDLTSKLEERIEDVTLALKNSAVTGKVELEGRSNHGGAEVVITSVASGNEYSTTTKNDGSFIITGIAEYGTYNVVASCDNYISSGARMIEIAIGNYTDVGVISLKSSFATVSGKVTLKNASSFDGITVKLSGDGEYSTVTDASGNYTIGNVEAGTYSLEFSKNDYFTVVKDSVVISVGESKTLDMVELDQRTRTISGTLELEGVSDYSGVLVTASNAAKPEIVYSVLTNEAGAYYIQNIIAGDYVVSFSKDGYEKPSTVSVSLMSQESAEIGLVTMKIRKASVIGQVEVQGSPDNSGITVSLKPVVDGSSYNAVTSEDGTFAIEGITKSGDYILKFEREGLISSSVGVVVVQGEATNVGTVALKSIYASLSGTVRLYDGAGDSKGINVHIEMEDGSYSKDMVTGNGGGYYFSNLVPGTYVLTADKTGYDTVKVVGLVLSQGEDKVLDEEILPVLSRTIRGNVKLSGAENHAGISVVVESTSGDARFETKTLANGDYSVQNLNPGLYSVAAEKEGYVTSSAQVVDLSDKTEVEIPSITLEPQNAIVSGKVVLVGTGDYSGVSILLTNVQSNKEISAVTKSDGSFILTGVDESGKYSLTASKEGYITSTGIEITVSVGKVTEVDTITLASAYATVSGKATLKNASNNEGISVKLSSGSEVYTSTTDAAGNFSFSNVLAGSYSLEYSKDGYFTVVNGSLLVNVSEQKILDTVELDMYTRTISGNVKLIGKDNHSGITVTATNTAQPDVVYSTQTNGSGDYYIADVIAGVYEVAFSKDGYKEASTTIDLLYASGSVIGDMDLESIKAMLSGKVILEGRSDYSGVLVVITNADGKSYQTQTAANGSFSITGIDEFGEYSVSVSKDGYITDASKKVTVASGGIVDMETITLMSALSVVKGTINLEGAATHEGVMILIRSVEDESVQYTASTGADGSYSFIDVKPGTYNLIASKDGYQSVSSNGIVVNISSEKIVDDFVMDIAVRSVTGKVILEFKSDYSGVQVTATSLSDPSLIYSALTNSEGYFSLAGMKPGSYNIVAGYANYMTYSFPTVEVVSQSSVNLEEIELTKARGFITGIVKKEGFVDQSGINVELVGTEFSAFTNEEGIYTLSVPTDVYTGGLRFTAHNYGVESYTGTISILTEKTVSIPSVDLKATHVSPVYGEVEVKGFPDENVGIPVRIEELGGFETVTGEGGAFIFEDVPLGNYKVRFEKDNAPVKIVDLAAVPSDGIDLGTITIIPNAANIEGYVRLTGLDSHSGIKVTATEKTRETSVSTVTDSNGFFRITNIASGSTHTITFEKDGWTSSQMEISGLAPLETRIVAEEGEVMLVDETAPVLRSVTINNGSHTSADKNVQITLEAEDGGSGLAKMQYCFDGVFDRTVTMRDYNGLFNLELPEGNGDKTVYVKVYDLAGNESEIASATVTLTDQKTEVSGVLRGDNLHWTKAMSPYLVTGNLLVESGNELIVDPGVEVQFDGAYYLQVEGKITAVGTESDKIQFHGINTGLGAWKGINVKSQTGSIFEHVELFDAYQGICGYAEINNSIIKADDYAIGGSDYYSYYYGTINDSEIIGKVRIEDSICHNSIFDGYAYIISSVVYNSVIADSALERTLADNVNFRSSVSTSLSTMIYCSFSGSISSYRDWFVYSEFNNSSMGNFNNSTITNSNMINCGDINITSERATRETVNFKENFWGDDKTRMIEESADGNVDFINDYMDDFNLSYADYSGYKKEPIEGVGYQGDNFTPIDFSGKEYEIGDIGPAGGIIFFVDENDEYPDFDYMEMNAGYYGIGVYDFGYYRDGDNGTNKVVGTEKGIGTGRSNTEKLVAAMGDSAYLYENGSIKGLYAAKMAYDYEQGGYDDWFLPSKDELNLLYEIELCKLAEFEFWSSSEYSDDYAWRQHFGSGNQVCDNRINGTYVRPVRAFK